MIRLGADGLAVGFDEIVGLDDGAGEKFRAPGVGYEYA